jgi:carbamoyl-phosphate synthase small subunit
MTYPEIGNTGINPEDMESQKMFLNGFVIHEMNEPSNWRAKESLSEALVRCDVPAIAGIDTRALTSLLREKGTQKGYMCVAPQRTGGDKGQGARPTPEQAVEKAKAWEGLDDQDYAARVTCDESFLWDEDGKLTQSWGIADELPETDLNIVAYDFGIKWNILRSMRRNGMKVNVVPAKTPAADVMAMKPDGVFLSNGPADPEPVSYAIDAAKEMLSKVPMMGICLGHQILGLAVGGTKYRMKFGHHGCNHPVMDLRTRKVEITSQNHNFAIDADSLDTSKVEVTHINLNDRTVEGLAHKTEPMFCVQYHPEAGPGPHDPYYLFKQFRELIRKA